MHLLHVSLLGLGMTWATLVMMSPVSAQSETVHYNVTLMNMYVRLGQQLRNELYTVSSDLVMRCTSVQEVMQNSLAILRLKKVTAVALTTDFLQTLLDVGSYLKSRYAAVALAHGAETYTDVNDKIFTGVNLASFVLYNAYQSEACVLWDGVYAVEYRVHLTMNRLASTDLHVYSPTGSQLHIITSQWYKGFTPLLEVFQLQAGSTIVVSNLLGYSTWSSAYADNYMSGQPQASQLRVQYLSPLP